MKIYTGKGYISLWVLLGIWSVSALTSLPGLAVSPILGDLSTIFKHATEFDIQMLTSLPSLLIIPFILLAGKLSDKVGMIPLLHWGLWLFLLCGVLYFFCETITELIVVSALLGVGAGIITPLSTALVSRFFVGEQRTKQFGYSSAINNLALVVATAVTGYLADVQWRLPFLVYLLPAVSLLLVRPVAAAEKAGPAVADEPKKGVDLSQGGIDYSRLAGYMLYYFLITFMVMVVSVNLPFLMSEAGHDSGVAGLVISLFFLCIMLPGFFINGIISFLGKCVAEVSLLAIVCGLAIVFFNSSIAAIVCGVVIAGVGYGVAQPFVYDRTASVASAGKVTFALALVMTMNYVAVVACPPVVDSVQSMAGSKSASFAFGLNAAIGLAAFVVLMLRWLFVKYRYNG